MKKQSELIFTLDHWMKPFAFIRSKYIKYKNKKEIRSLRHVHIWGFFSYHQKSSTVVLREVRWGAHERMSRCAACNCLIIPVIKQVHVSRFQSWSMKMTWILFLFWNSILFEPIGNHRSIDWLNMTMPVHLFSSHYHQTSLDMPNKIKWKKTIVRRFDVLSSEVGACARYKEQICVNGPSCTCT